MSQHDPYLASTSRSSEAADHSNKITGKKLKLYRAALDGDWEGAEPIFNDFEEGIGLKISQIGDTALHIAAGAKRIDFVKKLMKKINKEDKGSKIDLTQLKNNEGGTALLSAAISGKVEIAEEIMKDNKAIAKVSDDHGTLPIHMAAALGHKALVEYLSKETGHFWSDDDQQMNDQNDKELFVTLIEFDMYDFALQMLQRYNDLAIARARAGAGEGEIGVTALHVLARKRMMFSNRANQHYRRNFNRGFDFGAEDAEKKKKALELVERIWEKVILLSHSEIKKLILKPRVVIFDAAERGNVEFLIVLIRGYPDLRYIFDENDYSIFHYAVKYRQRDVFNLIYEIGSNTEIFFGAKDKEFNNILHLAGMLAPSDRLNIAPGPAIQMKLELMWFKEVKKVVQPRYAEARNKDNLTPRALFTEKHKDLRDKGEEWMNNTAGSCMVVAALIATVAFAAAFTVPGGNNGDTGFPIFHEKLSFKIFAIADAISMVFSSISIVTFLSITTSAYAEEDFLWLLPTKLRFGLATLFVSMEAMMTVFCTTFFILFKDTRLWIPILVTVMACVPILIFSFFYNDLLMFSSNHFWDLLFRQRKISLFGGQNVESSDQSRMARKSNGRQSTCGINV